MSNSPGYLISVNNLIHFDLIIRYSYDLSLPELDSDWILLKSITSINLKQSYDDFYAKLFRKTCVQYS